MAKVIAIEGGYKLNGTVRILSLIHIYKKQEMRYIVNLIFLTSCFFVKYLKLMTLYISNKFKMGKKYCDS